MNYKFMLPDRNLSVNAVPEKFEEEKVYDYKSYKSYIDRYPVFFDKTEETIEVIEVVETIVDEAVEIDDSLDESIKGFLRTADKEIYLNDIHWTKLKQICIHYDLVYSRKESAIVDIMEKVNEDK